MISVFVIIGDFNTRLTSRWSNNIDSLEGTKPFSLSTSNGSHQIISESTHIQRNSSSCIDLIFTGIITLKLSPPNHTFIIITIIYVPPYQRLLWNYK